MRDDGQRGADGPPWPSGSWARLGRVVDLGGVDDHRLRPCRSVRAVAAALAGRGAVMLRQPELKSSPFGQRADEHIFASNQHYARADGHAAVRPLCPDPARPPYQQSRARTASIQLNLPSVAFSRGSGQRAQGRTSGWPPRSPVPRSGGQTPGHGTYPSWRRAVQPQRRRSDASYGGLRATDRWHAPRLGRGCIGCRANEI